MSDVQGGVVEPAVLVVVLRRVVTVLRGAVAATLQHTHANRSSKHTHAILCRTQELVVLISKMPVKYCKVPLTFMQIYIRNITTK